MARLPGSPRKTLEGKPKEELSLEEVRILRFIEFYKAQYQSPPTILEIARAIGYSKSFTYSRVEYLIQEGYLSQVKGKARTLRLLPRANLALKEALNV